MKKISIFGLIVITFIISFSNNCRSQDSGSSDDTVSKTGVINIVHTDYSKPEHWLFVPSTTDKEADVFYLYPTVYGKTDKNDSNICEINNADMLRNAKIPFRTQATAFESAGNIYAPYYRQVDAVYGLTLPLEKLSAILEDRPYTDVRDAFDYYVKNYNKGRPFVLAGHSQGANILIYLLADYMKANPQVYARMIAAYVIGYSVTEDYLSKNTHLKFAEGPDDTGVIVSYNTEAPVVSEPGNPVVIPGAIAINPITWTREETLATAEENSGSLEIGKDRSPLLDANGNFAVIKNYADARVDKKRGVIICSKVDADKLYLKNPIFGKGVYHGYDYPFYYFNIKENAANRIHQYFKNK
ncbi:MAG: DUF3089 domain-containing protein [Ignavibacteriae bacterium]|nr:DUF3089 domain-containing protein [Ignavibacteriota bacterium]